MSCHTYIDMCTADKMLSVYLLQGIPEAVISWRRRPSPGSRLAAKTPMLFRFWVPTSPCN